MKNLFNDLANFLSSLTLVDFIFFTAVMVLIILLVTMYYIIKINTWEDKDDSSNNPTNGKKDDVLIQEEKQPELVDDILNAIDLPKAEDEPDELLDLETLTKAIEYGQMQTIDVSAYEEEQEQKAIISYDELISKHNAVKLNYKKEQEQDGIKVKEVDLGNLTAALSSGDEDATISNVTVISYDQEEAFLDALKKLKSTLT